MATLNNLHLVGQRYPMLDCLRGLAALLVVLYHIIEILPWNNYPPLESLAGIGRIGWMGVDLFFVLSGFVITNLLINLHHNAKDGFFIDFMLRRVRRIAPLYLLTGMVFCVFVVPTILFEPSLPLHLITHLLFIHDWLPSTHGSINGSNWSIGVEIQFYILCAIFSRLIVNSNPFLLLGALFSISWAWRTCCWLLHPMIPPEFGVTLFFSTTKIFGLLDSFGVGIFFARLFLNHDYQKFFDGFRIRFEILLLIILIGLFTGWTFYSNASYWDNYAMVIFWRTLLAITFGLLVIYFALISKNKSINFFCWPFRYLGEISYGIYLWHLPVILAIKEVKIGDDPIRFSLYVLVTTLILSSLSWHFLEKLYLRSNKQ